jgi:hypothetical protein
MCHLFIYSVIRTYRIPMNDHHTKDSLPARAERGNQGNATLDPVGLGGGQMEAHWRCAILQPSRIVIQEEVEAEEDSQRARMRRFGAGSVESVGDAKEYS